MEENQTSSNVDYTFQLEPVSSGSGEAVAEGEPAGKRTNYGGITCCVPQCCNNKSMKKLQIQNGFFQGAQDSLHCYRFYFCL